ncbi:hypothetical protein CEUSTIGMA_g1746.t1 [Chlamydomonas eustigma]|uniref:ELYS-like domain-containing protein n=1 Tax=Chlamydomonas eustigma TaxID=1157962 RepID=A0A250WTY5_9CHLO|nr:hypothetical protein CEUSTIGMA_g1746.t1 [Chlamydomonas eustigma]|eukprot:GAX74297.1 hypothetical protein CEUSTIGMA_g1746.t1 [Chlamydomonas eustigma]
MRFASAGLDVDAEIKQAELLQKCFQVMTWCARHQLLSRSHTGRFASVPDWMKHVHSRREKKRTLFLDDILKGLRISGAYPFSSIQNMLYMLFFTVRDFDSESWEAKLSLLLYYLLDLDFLQPGGAGVEDFRCTFSLTFSSVACWQSMYLLDCVEQQPGACSTVLEAERCEASLQRACELLSSCMHHAETPVKVLQVLVELGRADLALSIHRAATTTTQVRHQHPDLQHAQTMIDLRLRCGMLTEAFLTMRSQISSLNGDTEVAREHVKALVVQIAEWAAGSSSGSRGKQHHVAMQRLCELPWNVCEEDALIGWMVAQLETGNKVGELLPHYFLCRGRVTEAVGAYNRLQLVKQQSGHGSGASASETELLQPVLDAMVNASASLLALPQSNVYVGTSSGSGGMTWPSALLQGFSLQTDIEAPLMSASVGEDGQLPPFMNSRMPVCPEHSEIQTGHSPHDEAISSLGGSGAAAESGAVDEHHMLVETADASDGGFTDINYGPLTSFPFPQAGFASQSPSLFALVGTDAGSQGLQAFPSAQPMRDSFDKSRDNKRARITGWKL